MPEFEIDGFDPLETDIFNEIITDTIDMKNIVIDLHRLNDEKIKKMERYMTGVSFYEYEIDA